MKAKKEIEIIAIAQEYIAINKNQTIDFNYLISMNETAIFLWENIADKDAFTLSDLVDLLVTNYEIDTETAIADTKKLINDWLNSGLIEE